MVLHVLMLSIVERSGLEAEHSYVEGYFTFLKVAIDSFEISALGRELTVDFSVISNRIKQSNRESPQIPPKVLETPSR
jgi:hypothetical protein